MVNINELIGFIRDAAVFNNRTLAHLNRMHIAIHNIYYTNMMLHLTKLIHMHTIQECRPPFD